jgi:hypothetical protein
MAIATPHTIDPTEDIEHTEGPRFEIGQKWVLRASITANLGLYSTLSGTKPPHLFMVPEIIGFRDQIEIISPNEKETTNLSDQERGDHIKVRIRRTPERAKERWIKKAELERIAFPDRRTGAPLSKERAEDLLAPQRPRTRVDDTIEHQAMLIQEATTLVDLSEKPSSLEVGQIWKIHTDTETTHLLRNGQADCLYLEAGTELTIQAPTEDDSPWQLNEHAAGRLVKVGPYQDLTDPNPTHKWIRPQTLMKLANHNG